MMQETLVSQGMPRDETSPRTAAVCAEIEHAVRFVVEDAPPYALRPLLRIDSGGLARVLAGASAACLAAGVGLGLTIVSTCIEACVPRTVSGPVVDGARSAACLGIVSKSLF